MSNYFHAIYGQGGAPAPEPVDLSPVLLWTNPSPTAEFAAQTVSLNLTDYAGVIIEYNLSKDAQSLVSRVYVKKNDNINPEPSHYFGGGLGTNRAISRGISQINDGGIAFLDAVDGITNPTNSELIPTKIYGVKEYVVEPVSGDLLWTNPNPTAAFAPQKLSVDLSNSKGAIIEVMISTTSQTVCSKQLVYKGDGPVGIGYSAGGVAQTRNITSVEADGITFETGYSANTASDTILIPYKIYSIN